MRRYGYALLSGSLFGAGLRLSGMTDTLKVQGWLDVVWRLGSDTCLRDGRCDPADGCRVAGGGTARAVLSRPAAAARPTPSSSTAI